MKNDLTVAYTDKDRNLFNQQEETIQNEFWIDFQLTQFSYFDFLETASVKGKGNYCWNVIYKYKHNLH